MMEKKIQRSYIDYGFGFPVKLLNVRMVKIYGVWTPAVNFHGLTQIVLKELCLKNGRLTGDEVRYIRHHFEMTLQEFAKRFRVTHPCVLKWESYKHKATGMNWATEKDIRLFTLLKLKAKSKDIMNLYEILEELMSSKSTKTIEVDVRRLTL